MNNNKDQVSAIIDKNNNKSYILMSIGVILMALSFYINTVIRSYSNTQVLTEEQNKHIDNIIETKKQLEEGDLSTTKVEPLPVPSNFTAKSYLLYDLNSKQIVGGENIDMQLPNASTTKLMTAYVALKNYSLDTVLPVPDTCIGLQGNNVGIKTGERFLVEDLLYGLLLRSASDVSCVFAENYPGGYDNFIKAMNSTAKELNLENTNFTNPIGLDAENHYSSSNDLLSLILFLRDLEKLKIIMGTREYTLKDLSNRNSYYVSNTNELLFSLPGTVGYKTGYTSAAKECLVFGYENFGVEIIAVIMGSDDRFSDVKTLLNLYLTKINSTLPLETN